MKPEVPLIQLSVYWTTPDLEKQKKEKIRLLSSQGLYAYTLESEFMVPQPPLVDKLQDLKLQLDDRGVIGPILFLPTWSSNLHLYQVKAD